MRHLAWRLALAAALGIPVVAAAEAPGGTLFLDAEGTPTMRYALRAGARELRLASDAGVRTYALARRAWDFDKNCLRIAEPRLEVLSPKCGSPEIKLRWDRRKVDRMYPPVVRLQNGGVLVFAAYVQPLNGDGRLAPWTARAPEGGIAVVRGEKSAEAVALGEFPFGDDARGWVYLGPDRFREENAGRMMVDDGVPIALEREILSLAPRLLEAFERRLSARPAERPTIYLTWMNRDRPGRDIEGDVVPGSVVRFNLEGSGWSEASPEALAEFRWLVAHELAHLWNIGVFRPAPWAAPWITEGGAELLSVAALMIAGRIDAEAAAERVSRAFNECIMIAGSRSWIAMGERDRGKTPYSCGMAMQFGVLAAAAARSPGVDAFGFWKGIWARWPRYYESVMQQSLAYAGAAEAAALLQAMLTDPSAGLARSLEAMYRAARLSIAPAKTLSGPMQGSLRLRAVMALMGADCGGNASIFTEHDALRTGSLPCRHLKGDMKVRYFEGEDLMLHTVDAVRKAGAACSKRKSMVVRTLEGVEVSVPCGDNVLPDLAALVEFDAAEVARLLQGAGLPPPPRAQSEH